MVEILIDIDDIEKYTYSRLGLLHKKAGAEIIKAAINKTAKEAKKLDERKAKQIYTAKKNINSLKLSRATTSNLEAVLRDRGKNIGIAKYTHYARKKAGISAVINKTHGRKTITKYGNKAFTAEMSSGHEGVFVRVPGTVMQHSKSRYQKKGTNPEAIRTGSTKHNEMLEELKSISSPVIHGNDNVWLALEPQVKEMLFNNLREEVESYLMRY